MLLAASITHGGTVAQTVRAPAVTDVKTEVLRKWIGERIFFDTRLSEPAGVSCASCHEPSRAFTGDNNSKLGVARGSKADSLGTRNTP
ncbi:MAG: cytochrome c peroxidase, partial [Burkholderiaceae bacterium]